MKEQSVQDQTELLRQLQEIDRQIFQLETRRRKLEGEQAELDSEVGRIQEMADSLAAELDELRAQRLEIAKTLGQEEENVSRSEGRLPGIKTQKEYVAVLKEIDSAKKLTKELRERLDDLDRVIAEREEEKAAKDAELKEADDQMEERRKEIGTGLKESSNSREEQDQERKKLLGDLPVPLRKRYQLLLDRREGIAVVEAREGTCMGCNMQLPPQVFNNLFQAQEVQTCPHCNRLLYVESLS